jgi:stage V sporulation protein SpoVS
MTAADVIAWHAHEAKRYLMIAGNWVETALAERSRQDKRGAPNAVRAAALQQSALTALTIARAHLEMAFAVRQTIRMEASR